MVSLGDRLLYGNETEKSNWVVKEIPNKQSIKYEKTLAIWFNPVSYIRLDLIFIPDNKTYPKIRRGKYKLRASTWTEAGLYILYTKYFENKQDAISSAKIYMIKHNKK